MPGQRSRLKLFPVLALAIFLLPVIAGLLFTWAPAFGYLSAVGSTRLSLEPLNALLHHPSLPGALRSTLVSGLGASLFSLVLALWITATLYGTRLWAIIQMSLAPLLSLPHAAFAIGFTFLIAPSGWLIRAVSPYPSGFVYPPDWTTAGDPWAISLTLTMLCKETPFLLLMIFSGLNRIDIRRTIWIGRSLGYRRLRIWTRLIIPQLYPMLRLPLLAVLAYSLSVVDLAYIIGPSLPPTLAVLIDRWFNSPEISNRFIGAAGALLLLFVTLVCIGSALALEYVISKVGSRKILDGRRASPFELFFPTGAPYAVVLLGVNIFSIIALLLWSVTRTWRFPHFFPSRFSLSNWTTSINQLIEPCWVSGLAALLSCVLAIIIVIGCFENEQKLARAKKASISQRSLWIIYLPLLIPQISFLFGIQVVLVFFHLEGTWAALVWIHLVFVLPYVFLTLATTYRSYDQRYSYVGKTLCGGPLRTFFRIKLFILAKPILFSMAVGFGVSIAQYLPTLYVGAGRFTTITTETVSLASGSDRRIMAVYALSQLALALAGYLTAIILPAIMFRKRQAMQN
ncbi:MAG: ABC transporter permease [Desulfofustis sp.]|nr:ABC transporter permease [Desulfofustis sp.]